MAILKGIVVGAMSASFAVASIGALLGYVGGWASCHGVPYSAYGAYFGFLIFLCFFGAPAPIVGAVIGGVAGSRARPAGSGEARRPRWSLGRTMAIIALIELALALARPFIV